MKRFSLLLITIMSGWAFAFAQDKSKTIVTIDEPPAPAVEYNPKAWKEFSSEEGRFSIRFPGTPIARTRTMQTSAGEVIDHVATLKLSESYYHVNYLDLPTYADTDEFAARTLQAGRDGMLASTRGMELLGEQQIVQNGFKGREYLVLMDKFSFGITRVFLVHGRLYELGLLVPADVAFKNGRPSVPINDRTEFFNTLVSRFLDSFKLVEIQSSENAEATGEVDRMVADLRNQKKEVTIVAPGDPSNSGAGSGGILNGRALHLGVPQYPAVARSVRAAGQVSVKVLIDLEGNVAAAQVIDGHPLLRAAALKAARESKFTPTQLEGKPVILVGVIVYNFVTQ